MVHQGANIDAPRCGIRGRDLSVFGLIYRKLKALLGGAGLGDTGRDRRREFREDVMSGTVEIQGRSYPVKNWSSTGFLAAPCDCKCSDGDSVPIRFHVEVPGKSFRFDCKAILVRVDGKSGEVAGVFTMMDRETRVLIANHFD